MATTAFCLAITLAAYIVMRGLYMRFRHPLLNIVALGAAAVIAILVTLDIPYRDFEPVKNIMGFLLGPATVGLAVPLYRQRHLLRRYGSAIIGTVAAGAFIAMLSAAAIAKLGGLPRDVVASIMPKGATIPIAVEIASMYGGIPPLTIAFVVATGTLGSLIGGWVLNLARVSDPVARGLALGTTSHGQGTATALMEGEQQGAMAGLAMILSGILTAAMAPLVVWLVGVIAP